MGTVLKILAASAVAIGSFIAGLAIAEEPPQPSARGAVNDAAPDPWRSSYALLAFSYREPGRCPPCDRARPIVERLAREYPIRFVYWDDPRGAAEARRRAVDRFPTFALVRRSEFGEDRELVRWSGALDVERRIREVFARFGFDPRPVPRPPRDPRPAPRPKPRPKPAPGPRPIPKR